MSSAPPRILVVDDEPSIRRSLRAFLEDEGFAVTSVATAEEGLAALAGEPFDGAIVDMRLPGMDGNAFIVKAHRVQSTLAFLIYTGSVGYVPLPELQAVGIGEEHVFIKPLNDLAVLTKRLRRLLDERYEP